MQATTKSIQKDKNQTTEYRVYVRPEDERALAEKVMELLLASFLTNEVSITAEENGGDENV